MSKPALGRGLSALLGGKAPGGKGPSVAGQAAPAAEAPGVERPSSRPAEPQAEGGVAGNGRVQMTPVDRVRPSELQPRRVFPEESLRELADSIREQGILQPLVARPRGEHFELIAGERRWRAAQLAGLREVPVLVREADDVTALELMLVENLQREDLNPMDEAQGYAELMEKFKLTQEAVAARVGRSRAAVANALRFLKLSESAQELLRTGRLSAGHAKVILGLGTPELQSQAAERVVADGLSVRQAEELVARLSVAPAPAAVPGADRSAEPVVARDPHVAEVEDQLRQRLGTKVTVRYRQGKGQIDIRFYSDEELERVLEIVGVRVD